MVPGASVCVRAGSMVINPNTAAVAASGSAGGASATDIRKLKLIVRALELRKRRPEAFAGSYEPIDAGDRAIAYLRGGVVVVAAEIFPGGADAVVDLPDRGRVRLADVLDDQGVALLEL